MLLETLIDGFRQRRNDTEASSIVFDIFVTRY